MAVFICEKKMPIQISKQTIKGFSLLSSLVFLVITSFLMLGIISYINFQNQNVASFTEKLSLKNFEEKLIQTLRVEEYCSCLMRGATLDADSLVLSGTKQNLPVGYTLPPPSDLSVSCKPLSDTIISAVGDKILGGQFKVDQVTYENSTAVGSFQYQTFLKISLSSSDLNSYSRPIRVPIIYGVNSSDPVNAQRFSFCGKSKIEPPPAVLRSGFSSFTPLETGRYRVDFFGIIRGRSEGETYLWMTMDGARNPAHATEARCGQRDAKSGGNTFIHCPFYMSEFWNLTAGITYNFGHSGWFPGGGQLLGGGASDATWIISKDNL